MNYDEGAEGGFILYNSNETVRMELEGGDAGKRALISQIENFPTGSNRSARAAGEAIDAAADRLLAAQPVTDAMKLMIQSRAKVDEIRAQAEKDGMTTLKQDGIEKIFAGLLELTQVRKVCMR